MNNNIARRRVFFVFKRLRDGNPWHADVFLKFGQFVWGLAVESREIIIYLQYRSGGFRGSVGTIENRWKKRSERNNRDKTQTRII